MIGVYFLKKDDKVVYVGQSNSIELRLRSHEREGVKDYDSVTVIECKLELLSSTEEAFILLYNPKYNKARAEIRIYTEAQKAVHKVERLLNKARLCNERLARTGKKRKLNVIRNKSCIIEFNSMQDEFSYELNIAIEKLKDIQMNRHENRCANTEALDRYLAEEDSRAELLEEFDEITKAPFDAIEEAIFHIRNKEEAFSDLDLTDEIKSRIMEML